MQTVTRRQHCWISECHVDVVPAVQMNALSSVYATYSAMTAFKVFKVSQEEQHLGSCNWYQGTFIRLHAHN